MARLPKIKNPPRVLQLLRDKLTGKVIAATLLSALLLFAGLSAYRLEAAVVLRYKLLFLGLIVFAFVSLLRREADHIAATVITFYVASLWLWNLWLGQAVSIYLILPLLAATGFICLAALHELDGEPPPWKSWPELWLVLIGLVQAFALLTYWQSHPSNRAAALTIVFCLAIYSFLLPERAEKPPLKMLWGVAGVLFLLIIATMQWGIVD